MTEGLGLAARASSTPGVMLALFSVGGVVALWCGLGWAFNVRGITTRRSERIRSKNADVWAATGRLDPSPSLFGTPGYLRFLGAVMAVAGLVLLLVTYALWHLG